MSDMSLDEYSRKFINYCEIFEVEFDEELFYKLVEERYGKIMVPVAKIHVLAWQNYY